MKRISTIGVILGLVALVAIAYQLGWFEGRAGQPSGLIATAEAQEAQAKKPAAWYPRTEKVGPDEMFIVALGTGMPTTSGRA